MPEIPCLYARDFPLIAAMGANAIRTYSLTPPSDKAFAEALESSGLYWLAGFPLDPYFDPAREIGESAERILADFRAYASRFRGEKRLIAYVFGNNVHADYGRKFAGDVAGFYELIARAARVLSEIQPRAQALLTTAVADRRELAREVPGLSFWSWNAASQRLPRASLDAARRLATRPVLISEYGIDAYDHARSREDEQAQAAAAFEIASEIESSNAAMGGVYFGFVDEQWRGSRAWSGLFRAEPGPEPGLDSLQPRAAYFRLAGLWRGTYPQVWREKPAPRLLAAPGANPTLRPGAVLRLAGEHLLHPAAPYSDESWPIALGASCLCVGTLPARLNFLSPREMRAQIPLGLEAGERAMVFFRAGRASNVLPVRIERLSAGGLAGPVLEARRR